MTTPTLAEAIALAATAHARQIDKSGKPYILHPIRVMQACATHGEAVQMVAVLHDVVEDTWVTLTLLESMGFPAEIVSAVDAISQREGLETYFEYIKRCSQNRMAALVKLADLEDNSRPDRRFGSHHDSLVKRYEKAREIVLEELARNGHTSS